MSACNVAGDGSDAVAGDGSDAVAGDGSDALLPRSVAAARRAGFVALRHVTRTGSTNEDLIREARRGIVDACVLVADNQTAGRGRMGRHWSDPGASAGIPGALLVSFRLPGAIADASGRMAAVSAAALWAVADAGLPTVADAGLSARSAGAAVHRHSAVVLSKWPNDLVVEFPPMVDVSSVASEESARSRDGDSDQCLPLGSGKLPLGSGKLAGVLAEAVDGPVPVVVVGLGLNLSPVSGEPGSISLSEVGVEVSRDELLSRVLDAMSAYMADPPLARAALRTASSTIGRGVRVEQADGTVFTGTAVDIDPEGRLAVRTSTGIRLVEAGDVHHIRHDRVRSSGVFGLGRSSGVSGQVISLVGNRASPMCR